MRHNILITSAGKRVALVRTFRETLRRFYPDAEVFTADMNPHMAPAAYVSHGCFRVPHVSDPAYTDVLLELCRANGIGMIVPTIDTELSILAEMRERFAMQGTTVVVSDPSFIRICRDKRNTIDFFETCGVRNPLPVDRANPTFPFFAKPYDGSLSCDLHYVGSEKDLTPDIVDNPKLLFMEYIDKRFYKEFTVDMYYGSDHTIKCIVPRERIEIRAGEINKGRTCKNGLVDYVRTRLGTIEGCIGCICLQLFYDAVRDDVVGIEINPRFGGGYPLAYASGANYPEMLIREYFLHERVAYSDDWQDNMLMLRYDDAIFV